MHRESQKKKEKREKGGRFVRAGNFLISIASISSVDIAEIETLKISVHHDGAVTIISGPDAVEALMALKPSALEGRRMRWVRHAWAVHNLIGHPLMQMLSFLRLHGMAIRVHDATVPKPKT